MVFRINMFRSKAEMCRICDYFVETITRPQKWFEFGSLKREMEFAQKLKSEFTEPDVGF